MTPSFFSMLMFTLFALLPNAVRNEEDSISVEVSGRHFIKHAARELDERNGSTVGGEGEIREREVREYAQAQVGGEGEDHNRKVREHAQAQMGGEGEVHDREVREHAQARPSSQSQGISCEKGANLEDGFCIQYHKDIDKGCYNLDKIGDQKGVLAPKCWRPNLQSDAPDHCALHRCSCSNIEKDLDNDHSMYYIAECDKEKQKWPETTAHKTLAERCLLYVQSTWWLTHILCDGWAKR